MAAEPADGGTRRGVVPAAVTRSLWAAAAWTGAGTAVVGAVVSIAVVAVCWLPASAGSGSAGSAIRAGVLTFLAALHGGITVDGVHSAFVPLGMTLLVAALAWRAGAALAATADDADEQRPRVLLAALGAQAVVFAAVCAVAAGFAGLGTSAVAPPAAFVAALLLFGAAAGTAFVRCSPLADDLRARAPGWSGPALRAAAAGIAVYLAAGAVLVAGSLILHHGRVETISHQVGGGWGGVPVLLLGILAAPNAVVAAAAYLLGPGFAVGGSVSLGAAAHGTVPAFPVLGALPSGPATTPVWLLAAATAAAAGSSAARATAGAGSWPQRLRAGGAGVALAVPLAAVLAWQGGGAVGTGALATVGASPWRVALALGAVLGAVTGAALGSLAALAWWRGREHAAVADAVGGAVRAGLALVTHRGADDAADGDEADGKGRLAG